MAARNVVAEMVAELTAVKPAREPKRELRRRPQISFEFVESLPRQLGAAL